VSFPFGTLICVTGVSGSGKSTLINRTLQPILSQHFYRSLEDPLAYDAIEGIEHVDKIVNVDQSPIGRSPRSNPATYTGVFSDIRNLFVELPESKVRGYKPGRFSFNVSGGRCETCKGNGYKTIEMNFLPDVLVPCEDCHGKRYNRETLEVRFRGKSIADILDMTINMAVEFFENIPTILSKIKVLQDVGLGYIKLGQPSTTLSGGESQRVKLATELAKRDTGKTLYVLDEPTTGLHFEDIRVLLGVLNKLVDKGKTIIAVLIPFCQLFPFFRFPLHSPLLEPLFFSPFNLVELFLCIINSKLLQIFSGSHSIHMKAFPVMLVHLFR